MAKKRKDTGSQSRPFAEFFDDKPGRTSKAIRWCVRTGDCLNLFRDIPDRSVPLVFADPPYNIGYSYDKYEDNKDPQAFLDWCQEWIQEVHRVLKPHGTFWLAMCDEYAAELKAAIAGAGDKNRLFNLRSWVVWHYSFGAACQKNFSRTHTHLLYLTKTKTKFTFNADAVRVPSARQLKYGDSRAVSKGKLPDNTWVLHPDALSQCFTPDMDTWLASRVCGTFHEREERGTYQENRSVPQMPITLLERVVLACSKPGDVVLDPFAGTSTTGAAAVRHGRSYIGFDISQAYVRRGRDRLRREAAARERSPS